MTLFLAVAAVVALLAVVVLMRPLWRRAAIPEAAAQRPSLGLAATLGAFVLAVAAVGYATFGSPEKLDLGPQSSAHEGTPQDVVALVDKLARRMEAKPDDPKGWLLLGRSYLAMGRNADAAKAFGRATALVPGDADALADQAYAVAMTQDRNLEGEPRRLIEKALQADPKNPKALTLAGSAAFARQDYKTAVERWQALVDSQPADSPFVQEVQGGIAQARERAGMPPAAAAAGASAPAVAGAVASTGDGTSNSGPVAGGQAKVSGMVRLADSMKAKVSPEDTVFVFARAEQGPRMPLAIVRRQVKDLPVRFTLDDAMAMSPQTKLSAFARVAVSARISKSGNAVAQPGDLEAKVANVAVGADGVILVIDHEVSR